MEEVKDIVLNVYTLSVPPTDAQNATSTDTSNRNNNQQRHSTSWSSFFVSQMLPSMGMGAYHTSLRIGSHHDSPYTTMYTFVANQGIVSSRSRSSINNDTQQLPSHATFKEEIVLGACTCSRDQVHDILQRLSQYYFTKTSYHLVHRNCNHFTETFATALIHYSEFMNYHNNNGGTMISPRSFVLYTYPDWINRLAHTGASVIAHDADIRPCRAPDEAYHAVTNTTLLEDQAAAGGSSSSSRRWGSIPSMLSGSKSSSTTSTTTTKKKNEKKELTEAQQKLLDKIRKK